MWGAYLFAPFRDAISCCIR